MHFIFFYLLLTYFLRIKILCERRKLNSECEEITNCYNCHLNSNCVWCNNLNKCLSASKKKNCNTTFISNLINNYNYLFLTNQYQCIEDESDIEYYNNKNYLYYSLDNLNSNLNNYLYKIICVEFPKISKILINVIISNNDGLYDISYYNYLIKEIKEFELSKGKKTKKITSLYLCLRITYLPSSYKSNTLKFEIKKINNINISQIVIIIGIGVISLILIISFIILVYKKYSKKLKEEISIKQKKELRKKKLKLLKKKNTNDSTENNSINKSFKNEKEEIENMNNQILSKKTLKEYYEKLKKKINLLPSFIIDEEHNSFELYICNLCEKKFEKGNKIIILNCNHFFHKSCLKNQLITNENNNCIICKSQIIQ